jgi:hypothetical protein
MYPFNGNETRESFSCRINLDKLPRGRLPLQRLLLGSSRKICVNRRRYCHE